MRLVGRNLPGGPWTSGACAAVGAPPVPELQPLCRPDAWAGPLAVESILYGESGHIYELSDWAAE